MFHAISLKRSRFLHKKAKLILISSNELPEIFASHSRFSCYSLDTELWLSGAGAGVGLTSSRVGFCIMSSDHLQQREEDLVPSLG